MVCKFSLSAKQTVNVTTEWRSLTKTHNELQVLRKSEADHGQHALKCVVRVIDADGECDLGLTKGSERERNTYAAKRSGRSRYCQYSRLGMGSNSDAGRDSRLMKGQHSDLDGVRRSQWRTATE